MKNLFVIILLLTAKSLSAQEKTFVREYTYKASEMDSRNTCEKIAINQLQLTLLQEIGVYVESEQILKTSEVDKKFSQDFIENIATITAGITKLEVLEEKWNGETFWMKAAVTVDPKSLEQSLKQMINDKQKVKELEALKRQLNESRKEIEELNHELKNAKNEKQKSVITKKYNQRISSMPSSLQDFFTKKKIEIVPTYSIFKYDGDSVKCKRTPSEEMKKLRTLQPIDKGLEKQLEQKYGHFMDCVLSIEDILNQKKSGTKGYEKSFEQQMEALNYYTNKYKIDLALPDYEKEFAFYQRHEIKPKR